MKHTYSKIVFMALIAFGIKATAQCTSCTTTITGTDNANHIIASGTTLCVSPTGTLTGLITITSGGTLCNQGTVNSSNVWVYGGNFNNYGTISSSNILTSAAGAFNNFGTATIDSLLISQTSSGFTNAGTLNGIRLAVSGGGFIINNGSITEDYIGDSAATFSNNKNITINYDLLNSYNGTFSTTSMNSFLSIGRTFYNSTGATFNAGTCMIAVGQDWYNSATVYGTTASGGCGGFSIAGGSYNSGTVGATGMHLDLCDAGHPAAGVDGNIGSISSSTTFCACANSCVATGITEAVAESSVLIKNVYPNPAVTDVTIELGSKDAETLQLEMYDMMGRKLMSVSVRTNSGENKMDVDVSKFAAGTYILSITDAKDLSVKKMFNVSK